MTYLYVAHAVDTFIYAGVSSALERIARHTTYDIEKSKKKQSERERENVRR